MTRIKYLLASISILLTLCSAPVHAGIPVFDGTSIAQQIQQVVSWDKQLQQMANSLSLLQQQYTQMQSMTSKLDGGRGLGTILNDPNIQILLPREIKDPTQLVLNPVAMSTSAASINSIRAAFGIASTVDLSAGASSADALSRSQGILASAQLRQTQLQSLATRVDGSADAKSSLDLLNRNTLESAAVSLQLIQMMASFEAAKSAEELRAKARHQQFSAGFKAGGSAPMLNYSY